MEEDVPTQVVAEEDFGELDDETPVVESKKKELSISFQISDDIIETKIGSYYFKLIARTTSIKKYETVRIESYQHLLSKKFYFWCYRSHSELGMWRFGAIDPKDYKLFFKGPDKVQHTLIHLDLQLYINENIHLINKSIDIPISEASEYDLYFTKPIASVTSEDEPTFNNIHDESDYNRILNTNRRLKLYPFSDLDDIIKCGEKKFGVDINKVLNQFSENFMQSYIIQETRIISEYSYIFDNIFTATGHIYETILSSTSRDPNVILYYLKSTFTINPGINDGNNHLYLHINEICQQRYHIMPILLAPNNNINLLGVYEKYIPSGVYICKELDRSQSCSTDEKKYFRVTSDYTYIGSRYENLFPYVDLFGPVQPLIMQIEERKRQEGIKPVGKGIKTNKNNATTKKQYSKQKRKHRQKTKKDKTKRDKRKRSKKRKGKNKNKNKSKRYGIRAM